MVFVYLSWFGVKYVVRRCGLPAVYLSLLSQGTVDRICMEASFFGGNSSQILTPRFFHFQLRQQWLDAREGVINDPVQKVPFNGSLALIWCNDWSLFELNWNNNDCKTNDHFLNVNYFTMEWIFWKKNFDQRYSLYGLKLKDWKFKSLELRTQYLNQPFISKIKVVRKRLSDSPLRLSTSKKIKN